MTRQSSSAGSQSEKAPTRVDPIKVAEHRMNDFLQAGPEPLPTRTGGGVGPVAAPSPPRLEQRQLSSSPEISEAAFIIDTAPSSSRAAAPLYERISDLTLGSVDADPIDAIHIHAVGAGAPQPSAADSQFIAVPHAMGSHLFGKAGGAAKKATKRQLKREKRQRQKAARAQRGPAPRRTKAQAIDDSDIEWGSDGPPPGVLAVMGGQVAGSDMDMEGDGVDEDGAVLRDYMAGTLLAQLNDEGESDMDEDEQLAVLLSLTGDTTDGANETGAADIRDLDSGEEENPDVELKSGKPSDSEEDEDDGSSSELGDLIAALDEDSSEADEDEDDEEARGEAHRGLGSKATRGSRANPITVVSDSDSDSDDSDEDDDKEDESDEDEVERMFQGKDNWDETAWFLQSVEVCLPLNAS